ncbi:MAG: ACT domain-containing protein [Candidatus Auribacterota bacterium]|jgi:hypothetical protein|nr:ACT domain-containing protein [Candidatus Auribacterota bacterium]
MSIVELAVFMEDKVGRLYEITKLLADKGINIRGFAVSDSGTGFGILRVITNDSKNTINTLKERGFVVHEKKVLCVRVPDEVGGIAKTLSIFQSHDINVHEMYAIVNSLIVFHVDNIEDAAYLLKHEGMEVINQKAIEQI